MVIDVYLKINSIKGESVDDKHEDGIECVSVHWGITPTKRAAASTGGGHTAERAELNDITLHKLADLSSPILTQTCAAEKTLAKAKHEFQRAAALVALASTMSASFAAEHRIECPLKLDAESVQVTQSPAGWTPFIPGVFWLHAAGPMDGPPSSMADLQGDTYTKHGGKKTTTWTWPQKGDTYPNGKWMACYYGHGNDVILSRRIDDNASACTVTYTKNAVGRNDVDVVCQW